MFPLQAGVLHEKQITEVLQGQDQFLKMEGEGWSSSLVKGGDAPSTQSACQQRKHTKVMSTRQSV